MAFNLEKFRTNIRDFGYLDNNNFSVLVQTPPILFQTYLGNQGNPTSVRQIAQNMSFRIDQVRAPGIALMTADVNRYGVGPTQKQVFSAQFQEIFLSMLTDHYCEIWQYWYNWTRAIFQYNAAPNGVAPSYASEYKENYATTIVILIYDHFGNIIQKISLFEAFPTAFREVPLAWGDGGLMKINVGISFTEYTIENTTMIPVVQPQSRSLQNGLQKETAKL